MLNVVRKIIYKLRHHDNYPNNPFQDTNKQLWLLRENVHFTCAARFASHGVNLTFTSKRGIIYGKHN